MQTEIKFTPGYNYGYTTDQDMASVIATNVLSKLEVFDRVTLDRHKVTGEKYCVGEDFGMLRLELTESDPWTNDDPYLVSQKWFYNDQEMSLDQILDKVDKSEIRIILFNLDTLSKKEINLKEYDKNGLNYS